jgi:hypothetical protein
VLEERYPPAGNGLLYELLLLFYRLESKQIIPYNEGRGNM